MFVMQKQFRLPLIFFFIAACIGLLLRWHFVLPMDWLQFPNWLHAHSHTMFLGWIFNTLFLAYLSNYSLYNRRYKLLFIIIQIVLGGMLISFPIEGYGVISIVFSSLHTVLVFVFCWWIFKDFKKLPPSVSVWFAKVSMILFVLSSLGPVTLGPLVANGLGQTKWYYFSVYYYLHFQYNGVFMFGVLSLFFQVLEKRGLEFSNQAARKFGLLLLIAFFPTYFLSTLWAKPGLIFNVIGSIGAIIQMISLYYFIQVVRQVSFIKVNRAVKALMVFVFLAFTLKLILQLISAHPHISELAFEIRPFTIAYLHLVLIGIISFSLLAWYVEKGICVLKYHHAIKLLVISFVASEFVMILSGTTQYHFISAGNLSVIQFAFSIFIVVAIGFFCKNTFLSKSRP
jgi:hypothetical protein